MGRVYGTDGASSFLRDVDEICALPSHYAAYSGNSLPKFRSRLQGLFGIIDPC